MGSSKPIGTMGRARLRCRCGANGRTVGSRQPGRRGAWHASAPSAPPAWAVRIGDHGPMTRPVPADRPDPGAPAGVHRRQRLGRRAPDPRDARRAGLGELAVGRRLRRAVAHGARVQHRAGQLRPGPALLGQRRPDGPVLPRDRPRDQARGPGRRARLRAAGGPPRGGRRRWRPGARADLRPPRRPGLAGDARLGRADGHRHRVRPGRARAHGALGAARAADLPHRPRHRRRPAGRRRDRRLLHGPLQRRRPGRRRRRAPRAASR